MTVWYDFIYFKIASLAVFYIYLCAILGMIYIYFAPDLLY